MQIIISQVLINILKNISTRKQCFHFVRNAIACKIDERADNCVVTGIFPITDWLRFGISLKFPQIIHNIPRAVHINFSHMISIVPFLHLLCILHCPCIFQDFVDLLLGKSEIFIESGICNRICNKVICPCKNALFCNLQTACDNSKFQ